MTNEVKVTWFYESPYTHHAQTLIRTGSLGTEAGRVPQVFPQRLRMRV